MIFPLRNLMPKSLTMINRPKVGSESERRSLTTITTTKMTTKRKYRAPVTRKKFRRAKRRSKLRRKEKKVSWPAFKITNHHHHYFFKNGPFPASFFLYFRLFNTQLTVHKCSINFADDLIRTADLWYRKRPL